jgi:TonB family protein
LHLIVIALFGYRSSTSVFAAAVNDSFSQRPRLQVTLPGSSSRLAEASVSVRGSGDSMRSEVPSASKGSATNDPVNLAVIPVAAGGASETLGRYLSAKELDIPPMADAAIVVPFPDGEALGTDHGEVFLSLYVGADGQVDHVEILRSDVSRAFEVAAAETFRKARLLPGSKAGQPVAARVKIVVEFEERPILPLGEKPGVGPTYRGPTH